MADIKTALLTIFKHEGGYVNDPDDPGGETKYGISKRSYPHLDIKKLTLEDAAEIYRRDFWNPLRGDEIDSQVLATEVFDTAVNCGRGAAANILQKAVNLTNYPDHDIVEDGMIGPATISAVNRHRRPAALYKMLNVLQGMRYVKIIERRPQSEKFVNSWMARICEADFREEEEKAMKKGFDGCLSSLTVLFLVFFLPALALAADGADYGGVLANFLTAVVFPIVGAILMGFVSVVLNKVRKKYNLHISQQQEAIIDDLVRKGLAYAEEKAAAAVKNGVDKYTGKQKVDDAIAFVLSHSGSLPVKAIEAKVTAWLGLTVGVGATGDSAVGVAKAG